LNIRYLLCKLVLIATGMAVTTMPGELHAQRDAPFISQEYFVQQAPDEDLFIRVNGYEAGFFSRISAQGGQEIMLSGVPGTRLVPIFQLVSSPEKNRQLDIEVFSSLYTGRSEFGLELTRLKSWDERSRSVSRAYELLSFGMLSAEDSSEANWTVKIDSLVNAGRLFQKFGMIEMRLWSNYLAAHLIHYQLRDYSIAYSLTKEILAELKSTRFQVIELATLQLQSAALVGLKKAAALSTSSSNQYPIQAVLSRVNSLANAMGYRLEQALALSASGDEYVAGAFYPEALEQFRQAVAIADSINDPELATSIRERMVKIHAIDGDMQASSEVLQKIESQLQDEGAGDELALNLLAQGKLHIRNYRYDQAITILFESLEHENNSAIRMQVNFALAKAFYQTGRLDESMAHLKLAGIATAAKQTKRVNSMIDIGEGLWILSNIHRVNAAYEQMRRVRKAQRLYQNNQAAQLYDEGLDEFAAAGKKPGRASSLFRNSFNVSSNSQNADIHDLTRLQVCALTAEKNALCDNPLSRGSYERLTSGGEPRHAAQAMYLWSQILFQRGQLAEAISLMDALVNEIHLLRFTLPGVLGAWYREKHEDIFEYYLELLSRETDRKGRVDAISSLLVLSKIRYIESYSGSQYSERKMSGDTDRLRMQLAQRESSGSGQGTADLNRQINRGLSELRIPFKQEFKHLSRAGLQKYLKTLSKDEVVLTYHLSPTTAQVWIARKGGVQRRNVSNPAYIFAALQDARQGLSNLGLASFENKMDALGKRLAAPVADLLAKTVYWIPAGPLIGFPLDALRLKGRYLVEDHSVINLMSFPENTNPRKDTRVGKRQGVFLAGFPRDYSGSYASRLETSPEIQAVTDIFVGPGLNIVQGTALLPDEFSSEKFRNAQMIHLSMPGMINLQHPSQSSFELSGYEGGSGRATLRPYDIQSQNLQAQLVFLSATRLKERPESAFINQPGFVSDFINAGAQSVIARLWVSGGSISESFIKDFYLELESSQNVAGALTHSKRQYLLNNRKDGLYDWAGYQLFIE
jgi:CHAT domain-containing protein/tetratricopeptide (TPR) repeat protein